MKKVLFVLTSNSKKGIIEQKTGYYLSEASHPWVALHSAGFEIDYVSPKGGESPVDAFNLDDNDNYKFWNNRDNRQKLKNTLTPEQVIVDDYEAIHFVGGHGTMWDFRETPALADIAAKIYEADGIITAVCHGASGLLDAKTSDGHFLLEGKKVTGFSNEEETAVKLNTIVPFLLEDEIKANGGEYSSGPKFQEFVVIDGRFITGQNPASSKKLGKELVKVLKKRRVVA